MTDLYHVPLPSDLDQRQSALDPEGSFLCEAPAGSGKTELLTQRILTLLARVEKPEAILAITFTRKAAAEMRHRLLGALEAAQNPKPEDAHQQTTWSLARAVLEQDRRLQWQLLQNPNRLQIRTFDSLAQMLTQSLPMQSALGVGVKISEDSNALYREAVGALFETLDSAVPWADSLALLMSHLDNHFGRVEGLLVKMLGNRDVWMPALGQRLSDERVRHTLEQNLQQVLEDKVAQLHELVPTHLHGELLELARFAGRQLAKEGCEDERALLAELDDVYSLPDCDALGLSRWRALAQLLLTQGGGWRVSLDKRCGFPTSSVKDEKAFYKSQKERMQALIGELQVDPDLRSALEDVQSWPSERYTDGDWQILQALTGLLPVLVAHLQLVFRARGQVDFIEVSTRARLALGDTESPTDLALRLDYQIQHILVDEFQDTSFTQYDLLQKLTAGWQPGDGRTLFCVGDAMQSIYGFRGANVGLFLYCKYHGLGDIALTPLQLTTNFRSQAGVVEWVNATFAQAFPAHNDITTGAVRLAEADAFRPALDGPAVQTHIYTPEQGALLEARAVVELIRATRTQFPEDRIAVLVRNRSHARQIVRVLKREGIAFRAVDLEALADQPIIQDLMALTRALLFPNQRIAWLAVLRAPYCGLTLADLECIARQYGDSEHDWVFAQAQLALKISASVACDAVQTELLGSELIRGISLDGRDRLQRILPVLSAAVLDRQRKPLRQWIEGVWIRLGGPACLEAAHEKDNVLRFLDLLESFDERGREPSIDELQRAIGGLFAAPDPHADERLQIMTIHKSKGLEFDCVILPGLHRLPRSQDPELLMWQERLTRNGEEQLLLAPLSATGSDKNPIYRHLAQEKKKREQLETARLLYVACTRAKKRLHLLGQSKLDEGSFKPPASGSLLAHIWPAVAMQAELCRVAGSDADAICETPAETAQRVLQRLPRDWQVPELPKETLLDSFIPFFRFDNREESAPQYDRTLIKQRALGALLRQIAQTVCQEGLARWRDAICEDRLPFWRIRLMTSGVLPHELDQVIARVRAQVADFLACDKLHWMLDEKHQCQFEFPVSCDSAEGVSHGVVDVLLQDADGQHWMIVFNPSEPPDGQDRQTFVFEQKERAERLLKHHLRAVEQLGHKPVRAALFFVALAHLEIC